MARHSPGLVVALVVTQVKPVFPGLVALVS
jgi:hypothetical protein